MGGFISWLFILFPLAEVYLLIRVGSRIGFWDTVFLLILSAILGAYLAKVQGKIALQRIQSCLMEGRLPTKEMVDGVLIFVGGILFLLPGFISDILGMLLIFPPTRFLVRELVLMRMRDRISKGEQTAVRKGKTESSPRKTVGRDGAEDAEIIE